MNALDIISAHRRFSAMPGFERIGRLLKELGNPQEGLRFIHVVGTNGKGTTSTFIDSAMRESGYKTGLFTSPFIVEFRERFRINGEMIPEKDLEEITVIVHEAEKRLEGCAFTEFEFITAVGMCWFKREKCDAVVLEAGLGGGSDTTNVIKDPAVSVIVSISLDHTALLGGTIEEIAYEKADVIKNGGTVVLYPAMAESARLIVEKTAAERNAALLMADLSQAKVHKSDLFGTDFSYRGQNYHIGFSGMHQVYNALNAIAALNFLQKEFVNITEEKIAQGLKNASIPGRMEVVMEHPIVIIDGGHNPGCAEALRDVIRSSLPNRNITAVIGMMSDKDSAQYLEDVAGLFCRIFTVKPNSPRGLDAGILAQRASAYCKEVLPAQCVEAAVTQAVESAGDNGAVVVCGSFIVAGDARRELLKWTTGE